MLPNILRIYVIQCSVTGWVRALKPDEEIFCCKDAMTNFEGKLHQGYKNFTFFIATQKPTVKKNSYKFFTRFLHFSQEMNFGALYQVIRKGRAYEIITSFERKAERLGKLFCEKSDDKVAVYSFVI